MICIRWGNAFNLQGVQDLRPVKSASNQKEIKM